jgi:hypothetical protein
VAIELVFETHSITEDNERGRPTGWLVIGHVATRWALDHVLGGVPLEELAAADFAWQPGWEYRLPA